MCPFAAVHKPLSFVQRCEDLGVPRPLTAILLPFFLLLFHAGWAGGPKKTVPLRRREASCGCARFSCFVWLVTRRSNRVVLQSFTTTKIDASVTPLRRRQLERRVSTCALTNKLERARSLFPCSCFYDAACRLSSAPDAEAPAVAVSLFVVLCVAWLERLSRGARRSISPRSPGYFATSRALTTK